MFAVCNEHALTRSVEQQLAFPNCGRGKQTELCVAVLYLKAPGPWWVTVRALWCGLGPEVSVASASSNRVASHRDCPRDPPS